MNSLHCSFFISNGTKIFHTGISLFSLLKLNTFNTQLTIAKILCHNSWCGLQYPSEGTFLRGEKRGSSRWCSWVSLYHLPQCVPEHYTYSDIECLNKEGIEIELDVQLQYRARPKDLRQIILQFKDKEDYLEVLK